MDAAAAPVMDSRSRAAMYGFLAASYLRPATPELVALTRDEALELELGALLGEEAFAGLRAYWSRPADEEAVRQSYMDLFRVPSGSYVTPFESVYRDSYVRADGKFRRRLMGASAQHVGRFYEASGGRLGDTAACSNMPDFIGAELDFMRYLCERLDHAESSGDADQVGQLVVLQRRFLAEHLTCWIGELERAVAERDALGFYAGITRLARSFVAWDSSRLDSAAA